jgi:uncharacterized phiE125 gp8 family phage protein
MDTRITADIATEPVLYAEGAQYIKFNDAADTSEIALITSMIKACRVHMEKKTGLSFAERTYEVLFKKGDVPYVIPITPIISIDKVETVDYQGTKTELVLNSGYYKRGLYEIEIQTSEMVGLSNPWASQAGSYDLLVTFKAGYGHTNTQVLPEDIREAIKKQVMQWYDNRDDFYEMKLLGSVESILRTYMAFII